MLEQWAEQVVRDASEIIGHHVLVTGRGGRVIASSDPVRVTTLHTPSLKVLRTRTSSVTLPEEAARMEGVHPGITLPIQHGGRVVGTIAVAGHPDEVGKFGELVRRQAELYLRERTLTESRLLLERAVEELVQEVAFFDPEAHDEEVLLFRARELGFDLGGTRAALAVQLLPPPGEGEQERSLLQSGGGFSFQDLRQEVLGVVERSFSSVSTPGAFCGKERLILFLGLSEEELREGDGASGVRERCLGFLDACGERGLHVALGLGDPGRGIPGLSRSSREALRALRLRGGREGLFQYRGLLLEDLLASVPSRRRKHFMRRVLGALEGRRDQEELERTFLAWWASPQRTGEVAAALHLHRNTVMQRLEKLGNCLGLDLRDFRQGVLVYLALLCQEGEKGESTESGA